jgi:multiple sugar transport system ATP-binding protein
LHRPFKFWIWAYTVAQVVLEAVYKTFQKVAGKAVQEPGSELPAAIAAASGAVLRNIQLTVADGEFMVLVGPSGCGKSTLLRLIAGLEDLTGGNIYVGDRCVNTLPPKARDIAMVFQSYALYPHMTVYENLAFGLRRTQSQGGGDPEHRSPLPGWVENLLVSATSTLPKGWRYRSSRERAIAQQVREVAAILQIEPLLHRLPKQLSGGQKQRVALGRAMARQPQVFLMDEPLSNLDAKLRAETRSQIVKLQRQLGTTTIYVTHDQTEAMTMGDRITVLNGGQIQQLGTPLELYNHPANRFVAAFIGSPPMNFLEMEVATDGPRSVTLHHPQLQLQLPERWTSRLQAYVGRTVVLGIRPEHLSVSQPGPGYLRVQVDLVEALGNDTYLSVTFAGMAMQVRVAPDRLVRVGEELWLAIALDKIHLFDLDTGLAIVL